MLTPTLTLALLGEFLTISFYKHGDLSGEGSDSPGPALGRSWDLPSGSGLCCF